MTTISKRTKSKQSAFRESARRIMTMFILLALVLVILLRLSLLTTISGIPTLRETNNGQEHDGDTVILSLQVDKDESRVDIRIHLYSKESPLAANYIKKLATSPTESCKHCTLYRGEPVPSYWGSPDYPDRYFDGGRWGPPYALIQGGLLADDNNAISIPPAESNNNPIIERGMVAWAGGKGGPHFFIALAKHPEWKHEHTVLGRVNDEDDMHKVDALLLSRPLVSTKPKQPPIVSNFVTPIPFTMQMA